MNEMELLLTVQFSAEFSS